MSNAEVYQPAADLNGKDPALYGIGAPSNGSLSEKPGSSGHKSLPKIELNYSTDFPLLPEVKTQAAPAGAWGRRTLTMAVVTESFTLSAADRASMDLGAKSFGLVEQQKCGQIGAETNTKIELSEASDKSLTILISGKKSDVEHAHNRLIRELQTQTSFEVNIPREFYGAIIGKEGGRRKQLEAEYNCRIHLPGRDEQSDTVRIIGPVDQVKACGQKLKAISTELAKQASETLEIPKDFYPWIRGPNNETLDAIQAETGVKVNIPTSRSKNETIIIAGEREGVFKAVARVKAIFESCKKNNKSVTCKVNRAQHRFIIGSQRSGIDEILRQTGVLVEVPAEEEQSDTVTLRGPQGKLSDALALVFARASSIISLEIKYPEWQRRFLIGPKGATLQQLVPKQDRLSVEFENGGVIYLEGPPEAVKNAHVALSTEIARLTNEMASETVKVPIYLHRHIIGRSGALINKVKDDFEVQITIPDEKHASEDIRVEGKKEGVKNAVKVLKERAAELEKKMPADKQPPALSAEETFKVQTDVDPKWHKHFVLRGAEVIREIQDKFPGVIISFPRQDAADTKVHIKGPKPGVDLAKKRIEEIVEDLEAQVTLNIDIPKDAHPALVGHAKEIRQKYDVRLHFPPKDHKDVEGAELIDGILPSNLVRLQGRQPNVDQAKQALTELIPITKTLIVARDCHSSLIGKKGETIRKLKDKYDVRIKVPPAEAESDEVTIRGAPKNVEAMMGELKNMVNAYEKDAEDRVARSFKLTVEIPAEFHQRLIGTNGASVNEFQRKFDVHISFPRSKKGEPTENPDTITISGYEAKAELAREELLRVVEDWKNMFTYFVNLDPRFLARWAGPKARNVKKLQEDYNVEIIVAGRSDDDPSRVTVSGKDEDNVLDCIDKLRMVEEDFMQDVVERFHPPRREEQHRKPAAPKHHQQQVEIKGAPWQLDNQDHFPSMGDGAVSSQPSGVWGRRH